MLLNKRVYTVSELTRNIRETLEKGFGAVWVEGEVANFVSHQSGHMYFSIRDEGGVLSSVLFRRVNASLKFEIKNGMKVLCFGKISVYDKRGQYQLIVEGIEPKGAGALQVAFEQLKEKLAKEGLFDKERKRPIPYLPQRVGIITSPTGAAIRDILNVAGRRFSNLEIIIAPAKVQGEGAKEEIKEAIELLNALRTPEVIVLTRGGGSLEDLWPFNEETVARAIRDSQIPIMSAIGHEIDWTISDFVSDFRAATPSAAAELLIPKKEDLVSNLARFSERMKLALSSKVEFLNETLARLAQSYILREPLNMIAQHEQEIDDILEEIMFKGKNMLKLKEEPFKNLAGKLEVLNPLGILNRGYSVTMRERDKKIIKSSSELKRKEIIRTKLAKGEVLSRVEDI